MATLICILLSVLAIGQYSGYAPISWLDHGAAGSFTHYFKLAALLLPAIAIILLLVQQLLKPDQKQADETSGAGHKTEAGVLKAGTPLLEKTGFFIYKLSVWLVAGMVAGLFIATTQGFMPIWMVIVNIVGSIGLGWLFVYIFVRYQTAKYNSALHQSKEPGHTVTAHIDDMQFAGLRLMEPHQLMTFQLTVYPSPGDIYQTTIRQYMTQEALNNLQDIQYISFQEDPLSPGMGTILAKTPENKTRQLNINAEDSDSEKEPVKAVNYPHQIYNKEGKGALLTLLGQSQNKISRILNTFFDPGPIFHRFSGTF